MTKPGPRLGGVDGQGVRDGLEASEIGWRRIGLGVGMSIDDSRGSVGGGCGVEFSGGGGGREDIADTDSAGGTGNR